MSIELVPSIQCNLSCPYCVSPETLILTPDGSWIPMADVSVGLDVLGFDEHITSFNRHRRLQAGRVSQRFEIAKPSVRLVLADGRELVASVTHPLTDYIGRWREAGRFVVGQRVRLFGSPMRTPRQTDDFLVGYFVGISEGDGTIGSYKRNDHHSLQHLYRLAMNDTEALDRVVVATKLLGVVLTPHEHRYGNGLRMPSLRARAMDTVAAIRAVMGALRHSGGEWERGWISGMFDAEGSVSVCLRIAQYSSGTRNRIANGLRRFGFKCRVEATAVRLLGGWGEIMRFHSVFRPAVTRKLRKRLLSSSIRYRAETIVAAERIGVQDLQDITVDGCHTYFAAGIASHNCYQNPCRDAGNFGENSSSYDMAKMKEGLLREGSHFTLFGGEALLMPIADIEGLFKFGLEKYGKNGVQSNGVLITPKHIELFVKYKVSVGISADGPGSMNDSRWAGSLEKTRAATEKTMLNIEALVEAGKVPSLIVTLYRGNALPPERERLKDWFRWLDGLGISSARLHILEVDHPEVAAHMALTDEENTEILLDLSDFEGTLATLRFETFKDVTRLLTGDDSQTVCLWNACDPKTTAAVRGVDGQGHGSNCGRTNKDGVSMLKTEEKGYERQVALYNTPQSANGCQGCRFFIMCKGECPGTAVDRDWRNRTRDCETWKSLFAQLEQKVLAQGTVPLSLMPDKLKRIEAIMLDRWAQGDNIQIHSALKILDGTPDPGVTGQTDAHGDAHGDSNVSPTWTHVDGGVQYAGDTEYVPGAESPRGDPSHGDSPHGDSGHSTEHLDHEDAVNAFHGDESHGDCTGGRS